MAWETALIIPVPAAEPVVGALRSRLDRAAAWGVPAHVKRPVLSAAAAEVAPRLPFQDQICEVRLIAGVTGSRRWETVSAFSLGRP